MSDVWFEVFIMPSANDRMSEHFDFLAQVSEVAASRLVDRLISDIDSLHYHPHRCPPYDRPYTHIGKYRYLMSSKRYRIVYMVEGNKVFIDDIQDCRQDIDDTILFLDE